MVCGYTLPFVIAKIPMCDSSFDVSNPQMWCSYPLIWRFFVGKSWPVQVNWKAFKQISSFLWGRTPQSFPHFHRHPPPFLICRSSGMPILAKNRMQPFDASELFRDVRSLCFWGIATWAWANWKLRWPTLKPSRKVLDPGGFGSHYLVGVAEIDQLHCRIIDSCVLTW